MARMTRSRASNEAPSAAATASQPDIEDLIKGETSVTTTGAAVESAAALVMQHEAARHDFPPNELLATRTALLVWYDAHRRKLPWRGDPPPYLTTATHTSQKKKAAASGKRAKLDAFWKAPVKSQEQQNAEEDAAADTKTEANADISEGLTTAPRKVEPYETWVSEIMLQQTRVDTVVGYFLRWLEKFPTVEALANATEEDVNALWAGLGYYRRARMLHAGAKYVVANFGGELPSTVEQLLTIPGIGPYTAGAIASIAFRIREPLVDGNVIRVMARLRAVGADPKNKQLINFSWKAAKDLVGDCERPGALNQALMELGATVCTVQNPQCSQCPVKAVCLVYEEAVGSSKDRSKGHPLAEKAVVPTSCCSICDYTRVTEWDTTQTEVTKYPLKAKKNDSKKEVICVAVVSTSQDNESIAASTKTAKRKSTEQTVTESLTSSSTWSFLMAKRPDGGLLAGQWEFLHSKMNDGDKIPSFSKRKTFMDARLTELLGKSAATPNPQRRDIGELTHIFSHVKHHMGIEHLHFKAKPELLPADEAQGLRWMTLAEMQQLGITTGVKKILELVLRSGDAAGDQKKKKRGAASSQVTHVASTPSSKRLKSIASFFTK